MSENKDQQPDSAAADEAEDESPKPAPAKAKKKSTAKKSTAKKSTAKKSTAKKSTAKKSTAKKSKKKAESTAADDPPPAEESDEEKADREAVEALGKLSDGLFERLCRRLPMRTFISELQRIDRAVFFRYFKGYRPVKIDAKRVAMVLRKECFEKNNGLLAQLVIYNWDESEFRLYGALQKHVKAINEDVEAIEEISDAEAEPIVDDLVANYDRRDVCIAMVINGVRVNEDFLKSRFDELS